VLEQDDGAGSATVRRETGPGVTVVLLERGG